MTTLRLDWHDYSYFSYEQDLALREVQAVLQPESIEPIDRGLIAQNCLHPDRAVGLVYFGGYQAINGRSSASAMATRQHLLEASANGRSGRQATRYSTHGLHEYKGKFNPQTAQALMSLSGLAPSEAVLDPYFGSGTTLLEAAHRGSVGLGLDVNPLARLIAETKVAALRVHVDRLARSLTHAVDTAQAVTLEISTPRLEYLCKWIPAPLLEEVERLRHVAQGLKEPASSILLLLVSDLLRDYSLQEPQDLRIRRRRSPFPEKPFETRLRERIESTLAAISRTQGALDPGAIGDVRAVTADIGQMREMPREFGDVEVRAVITSPPYAMALP
jgi:site-specific DNA-methyltransferase (cytosine-N4-specific)